MVIRIKMFNVICDDCNREIDIDVVDNDISPQFCVFCGSEDVEVEEKIIRNEFD